MSEITKQAGACKNAMIRIKRWRAGFSIKCLDYAQNNTLMVTPFDEAHLQEKLKTFCEGCPALKFIVKEEATTK
jgi:hypothetical protein